MNAGRTLPEETLEKVETRRGGSLSFFDFISLCGYVVMCFLPLFIIWQLDFRPGAAGYLCRYLFYMPYFSLSKEVNSVDLSDKETSCDVEWRKRRKCIKAFTLFPIGQILSGFIAVLYK